jgi:hypothetical protein
VLCARKVFAVRKVFAITRAREEAFLPIADRAVIIWGERHVTDPREPPCGIVSTDRVFSTDRDAG